MFKQKGGGSKAFWTMLKKLHFSYTMASLMHVSLAHLWVDFRVISTFLYDMMLSLKASVVSILPGAWREGAMFDSIAIVSNGFSWANPSLMNNARKGNNQIMITIKTFIWIFVSKTFKAYQNQPRKSLFGVFFLRVLLLIVRRNGHKEVVKVWFLNLEIWLLKRLSFASI